MIWASSLTLVEICVYINEEVIELSLENEENKERIIEKKNEETSRLGTIKITKVTLA